MKKRNGESFDLVQTKQHFPSIKNISFKTPAFPPLSVVSRFLLQGADKDLIDL